jgi:hypothetical protein
MEAMRILITLTGMCFAFDLSCVSIVYNLRIAQTTRRQNFPSEDIFPSIGAITLFDQVHKLRDGTHQNVGGGLGTYILMQDHSYFRAEFAAGHVRASKDGLHLSRTQTDDILFSAGYNHVINDRSTVTLSGLLGFPTHKDFVLEGLQLGTGHIGCGVQLDGSYSYSPHQTHSVITAARFLHFFPRGVDFQIANLHEHFKIDPGNIYDLFIAHHSKWQNHILEVGYNPTFAFGAKIHPQFDDFNRLARFIRSSFYGAYTYGFKIKDHVSALVFGLSYGFDHIRTPVQNKYVVSAWVTWGINF